MSNEQQLLLAAKNGDDAKVRSLLKAGTDPDPKDDNGMTPLLLAARGGYPNILKLLINNDADIEFEDREGKTALLLAVENWQKQAARALMDRDAEINACDNNGQSALHIAARLGDKTLVNMLLTNDANADLVDDFGDTAFSIAQKGAHSDIAALIKSHMSDAFDSDDEKIGGMDQPEERPQWQKRLIINAYGNTTVKHRMVVALSPDDSLLASISTDVKIWEVVTGALRLVIPVTNADSSPGVAFSHDSKSVALTAGSEAKITRIADGADIRIFPHPKAVVSVCFSSDGKLLATGCRDNLVRLWNITNQNAPCRTLPGHKGDVFSVRFSHNSQLLASSGGGPVIVWDVTTGISTYKFHDTYAFSSALDFSPNDSLLACGSYDGTVTFRDTKTGSARHILRVCDSVVGGVSHGANLIITSCNPSMVNPSSVRFWKSPSSQASCFYFPWQACADSVASSKNSKLVAAGFEDGTIVLWWTDDLNL